MAESPSMAAPLVIYGGAFDPVHVGHLALAEFAMQELGAAELRFMPAGHSPWKTGHVASFEDRLALLKLACADSPFRVDEREGRRPGPSYTIDSLREIRAETNARLLLLMGADTLAGFPGWKDPQAILELAELVVINRPGSPLDSTVPHRVLQWPGMEISSSWLRQRMARGTQCRYLLPDLTWDFILSHGLYGCASLDTLSAPCGS